LMQQASLFRCAFGVDKVIAFTRLRIVWHSG
jgi:hypothetical protein